MAKTVARSTLQASASNGAGATTTTAYIDISGDYDVTVVGQITNGGTGPTVACSVFVEVADSSDANPIRILGTTAALGNSVVTRFMFQIPRGAAKLRLVFTGNTGQAVTVEGYADRVTGI